MSWSKRTKHPAKIVKEGDELEVVVLEVKTEQRRISLGLKQTPPRPKDRAASASIPKKCGAARSLGRGGGKISGGHRGKRAHPQSGGFWRVRGNRRGHG